MTKTCRTNAEALVLDEADAPFPSCVTVVIILALLGNPRPARWNFLRRNRSFPPVSTQSDAYVGMNVQFGSSVIVAFAAGTMGPAKVSPRILPETLIWVP